MIGVQLGNDALVILKAKVKRDVKMLKIYRCIAEFARDQQYTIDWGDTKVLDKTCSASSNGSLMHSKDPC